MRLLHTADWHLGRVLHGIALLDDQAVILDRLVDVLRDADIDTLLVAGDIYDRAVPAPDAVRLLNDFLRRVVLDLDIAVIMIAGNHDGPDRLGFGADLLATRGLHVAGPVTPEPRIVRIADDYGPVHIAALPFAEPAVVRSVFAKESRLDHDRAFTEIVDAARAAIPTAERSVLVAHAFVAGGRETDSERPLSVGGAGAVSPRRLDGFDYVALGHLHRPQAVGRPTAAYAGSLMKYSISEIDHAKSVRIVDLAADGTAHVDVVTLEAPRDLRRVEGTLDDLIARAADDRRTHDFIVAHVTDRTGLVDPMARLREVYPHCVHVERHRERDAKNNDAAPTSDPAEFCELELFERFFEHVTGDELQPEERRRLKAAVEHDRAVEREAVA